MTELEAYRLFHMGRVVRDPQSPGGWRVAEDPANNLILVWRDALADEVAILEKMEGKPVPS